MIIALIILLWLAAAIFVADDASKRGKSAALWFIIVFFLGLIGLIIWLAIRPPLKEEQQYHQNQPTPQTIPVLICPNCKRYIPLDSEICPYCRHEIKVKLKEVNDAKQ